MFRTVVFIAASLLLLGLDHLLQRHGGSGLPRWLMASIWVVLALWARIEDDYGVDQRAGRAILMAFLPIAGVLGLYFGVIGWSVRENSLLGVTMMAMLPGGIALLLWWFVELARGSS